MGTGPLVVTYPLTGRSRAIVEEELGGTAEAIYLVDLAPAARAHVHSAPEVFITPYPAPAELCGEPITFGRSRNGWPIAKCPCRTGSTHHASMPAKKCGWETRCA
jgi:hypothetical protein